MGNRFGGRFDRVFRKEIGIRYVYGLVDPRTGVVNYVGLAADPYTRFNNHLVDQRRTESLSGLQLNKKESWFKELLLKGLDPFLVILERCESRKVKEREQFWIRHFDLDGQRNG